MPCCMYVYHFFFKCVHVTDTKTQSRRLSAIDESLRSFFPRDVDKRCVDCPSLGAPNFFYPQTNALKIKFRVYINPKQQGTAHLLQTFFLSAKNEKIFTSVTSP